MNGAISSVNRVRLLGLACLLVGLLASCGSGSEGESDAAADGDEWRSPLAEYVGLDVGFDYSDEAEMEARQLEINDMVTACMAAEGFEWKPDPRESMIAGPPIDDEGLEWGSEEWTAKYGFGISTLAFPQDAVGPDLLGANEPFFMEEEGFVDPNEEYLNTLSEPERDEFYATLYGDDPGPDIDPEAMTEEEIEEALDEYYADYVPTGCMNEAQEEIMGFGGSDYFLAFNQELQDMYEQIEKDPRIATFEQQISECVSDKGQVYTDMQSVYEDFEERMGPLYDEAYSRDPFEEFSEEQVEAMSPEEMEELFAPELSDESKAILADIQAEELALAAAVRECGGTDEARADVYQEVVVEYEERFIEENRAALDAYLAEQGNGSGSGSSDTEPDDGDN
ncbi:MAG: hypothetical protein OER95_18855 [Acidimicrobiia bacterium]|nr:hypothetical protein [Acidimicrobiia bacterium]